MENMDKALAQSGQVREEIAKIQAKRIDLQSKMKPKILRPKDTKLVMPSQPQKQRTSLPLKELYLDDVYHCDKLEIHWTRDKLIIKSDKNTIFGPFDILANTGSLTYHDKPDPPADHSPIFLLTTIPGKHKSSSAVRCVAVKLDCSDDEDSYYAGLLLWLKNRIMYKKEVDREFMGFPTGKGKLSKARLDQHCQSESQRAEGSSIDDRSKPTVPQKRSSSLTSMRITPSPPPSSITASSIEESRKRPRQDTSDSPRPRRQMAQRGGPRKFAKLK